MPFDGLTIRALCREIDRPWAQARIDKIYQPEATDLVLHIRTRQRETFRLLLSAHARWARMHIIRERMPNPSAAPAFCMLLRKYLEGGKIKSIKQVGFERVVHLEIEALDDFRTWKDKLLICEFMGKHSNLILVNPETNLIIDAIKRYGHELSSYREILPGREYKPPPDQGKQSPLYIDFDTFAGELWSYSSQGLPLHGALFRVICGISPFSAREICQNAGQDPDLSVEYCGQIELHRVYQQMRGLIDGIEKGDLPSSIRVNEKGPVEYAPYPLAVTEGSGERILSYASIHDACDDFHRQKITALKFASIKSNLQKTVRDIMSRVSKRNWHQQEDYAQAEKKDRYRIWGEIITAYAYKLEKGMTEVELEDFYSGEKIMITLDPRYTPIQNAQKYFRQYNKSQKALKHLQKLLQENEQEIRYLETVILALDQAEKAEDISAVVRELEKGGYIRARELSTRPAVRSTPRIFLSADGFKIVVGKNNYQNDLITLKQGQKNDLWLHARKVPGAHVMVKLEGKIEDIHDVPDQTLEEAAGLAAYFSQAAQADKVEVDYTFRAHVKKPKGAKPGMVVYDPYWTILTNPRSDMVERLLAREIKEQDAS